MDQNLHEVWYRKGGGNGLFQNIGKIRKPNQLRFVFLERKSNFVRRNPKPSLIMFLLFKFVDQCCVVCLRDTLHEKPPANELTYLVVVCHLSLLVTYKYH